MTTIDERTRSRWLWLLTGATAAYALATVLVFYTTAAFGPAWLAVSVLVYGLLLASALALSLVDTGTAAQAEEAPATASERGKPAVGELRDHETLYATPTGRVLRAWFATDDGQRSLLFAIAGDDVLPVSGVERRLGAIDVDPPEPGDGRELEDALDRRTQRWASSLPDPSGVDVQLQEDEVLYRNEEGRILRVRYEADGEEHVRLFAITGTEVIPVDEVEGSLDTLRVDELPVEVETVFDEVIARGARPAPEPTPSADEVISP